MTIGIVGVGRMGANMARRLKDEGCDVAAIYDVNTVAARELAQELGATAFEQLSDVTANAETILTVVPDDSAMRTIFATSGDSLLRDANGRLFINCATVSPTIHVVVERLAESAGAQTLEACMASSITQAREGSLYLMIGGSETAFRRAEPVLKLLSASMRYVGAAGEAAKVKALVNMVMNINTVGLAEGLGLADALGLDLAMIREVFSKPAPLPACSRPTARTCKTANTPAFFPPSTRRRIAESRFAWRRKPASIFRWPPRRRSNMTGWSRKDSATLINRASPS